MPDAKIVRATQESAYEVHTPVFEGPLALLLRLIERKELDITRVSLAQVTDEFLEHVEQMRAKIQIQVVAEFLSVAAKLLWIKSRALLPKPPASANLDEQEDDTGDELIRQLRAYRQFKEAAGWLRQRDHEGLRDYIRTNTSPRLKRISMDISGLHLDVLKRVAETMLYPTQAPRPESAIRRPRISIVDQISLIRRRLGRWARVTFRRLLSDTPSRLEAVVTLQAILELMKQHSIAAQQTEMFGDIAIQALVPLDQIKPPGLTMEESTATES